MNDVLRYSFFSVIIYGRKGKKSREMYNEIDLDKIDIAAKPPTEEPARQYYFMAKCRRSEERRVGKECRL